MKEGLEERLLELQRVLMEGLNAIGADNPPSDGTDNLTIIFFVRKSLDHIVDFIQPYRDAMDRRFREVIDGYLSFIRSRIVDTAKDPTGYGGGNEADALEGFMEASRKTKTLINRLNEISLAG